MTEQRPLFRIYIAQSLDGFIASPDGTIDWLEPFPAATFGFDDFIAAIDLIVMGRASYEQVRSFGAWPYRGTPTTVLTSRPLDAPPDDVAVWSRGLEALVEDVSRRGLGQVWVMGGASTIGAFLDLGRVDRIEVFVLPLLLGSGVPLTRADEPRALSLVTAEALPYGVVRLEYTLPDPA